MAYSSANSITGGKGVRKVSRQVKRSTPSYSSANSITGGSGVAKVSRQTRSASPVPSTVPASNNTERPPATIRRKPRTAKQKAQGDIRRKAKRDLLTVEVPEGVPDEYKALVAKYGPMVDDAARGVGLSGTEYLARTIDFETGGTWNPGIVNPTSGATGLGQFMDYTAQSFKEQYGVDPDNPDDPESQIKGAAMHLSGDYGHPALYAGYNPGYSDEDPILSRDLGPTVKVKVKKGEVAGKPQTTKLPGEYAGSKRIVRKLLGPYAKTEDWKDKEPGHAVGGMHDPANEAAYAGDLPPEEGIVDRISRKLGLDPSVINYDNEAARSIGPVDFKGYEVEFMPYTHGSGPHVHIGAQWNGGEPPAGTAFGGSVASGSVAPSTGGSTTPAGPPALTNADVDPATGKVRRKKRKAKQWTYEEVQRFLADDTEAAADYGYLSSEYGSPAV